MDITAAELDALITQALNRMDCKNESAEDAAEAVTGGNRQLDALIVRGLQGESPMQLVKELQTMTATRKLRITVHADGFVADVLWFSGSNWHLISRAKFAKFPVKLCRRMESSFENCSWKLELEA